MAAPVQHADDLPGEDAQAKILKLHDALLHIRDFGEAKHLLPHPSTSRLRTSRSLVMMGRVISTVVPSSGME